MISLNTYSFAIRMGLISKNKNIEWRLIDFINYSKKKNIKRLEFPIDYFSKKEKKNYEYFLKLLKLNNVYPIIDLENFSVKSIKNLIRLSKSYDFNIIRVKMSNLFGGNRYLQKNFYSKKIKFIRLIKKSSKLIDKKNIKLLIENHQDLSSKEIIKIIKVTKSKNVGINWDIGNSLPTLETPAEFFINAKKYIFNVHCKDYKVILSKNGYYLKRTPLGKGVINFKNFINFFKKRKVNISLELGAHTTRHSDLFEKNFLQYHNISTKKSNKFKMFIKKNAINENPLTDWEIYKNLNYSSKQENKEFEMSLKYLKNL